MIFYVLDSFGISGGEASQIVSSALHLSSATVQSSTTSNRSSHHTEASDGNTDQRFLDSHPVDASTILSLHINTSAVNLQDSNGNKTAFTLSPDHSGPAASTNSFKTSSIPVRSENATHFVANVQLPRNGAKAFSYSGVNNGSGTPDLGRHPMNRNMEELHVPGGTGHLPKGIVKEYYRKLVKAYLATFENGIYRQLYFNILRRRTYALTPPGANKGVQSMLFQIIDRKVYLMDPYEVPRNSKPFYRTRINEVIWILSKLASEGRINNTEFLMSIHDCVQTVNKVHTYRGAHFQESNPAFTIVSCNFSDNIPFPMWEGSKTRDGGFSGWDGHMTQYAKDDVPWQNKSPRAVFRGGIRPSMYFQNKTTADDHCNNVGRTRLKFLSQEAPDLFDVSVGGTCGGKHSRLERLDPKEHHKFKYVIYAEGNCMWADRSKHQVFGPSAIIKQETPCGQFFEPMMKPYIHYIPTDFFFSNTVSQIKWARDNDGEVQAIVKNANDFAHNFLSLEGIETYVEVLLQEYTALLVEPDIKLENGATEVTNKRV